MNEKLASILGTGFEDTYAWLRQLLVVLATLTRPRDSPG